MLFTSEELEELAAADAEIEANFHLTNEDLARSRALDRCTAFSRLPPEKRKQAAQQKAYREANRDKVAAQKKAWYEANRDKVAAQQKAYREANRDKVAAQKKAWYEANRDKYNAYMRDYMRNRRVLFAKEDDACSM